MVQEENKVFISFQNKSHTLRIYRYIIKLIKRNIKEIDDNINDCIKTLHGYENFIMESMLFIKDRDNLISSKIDNIFKIRIKTLKSYFDRIPEWSSSSSSSEKRISHYKEQFGLISNKILDNLTEYNNNSQKDINTLLEFIPDYIQNINMKLSEFIKYQSYLNTIYTHIENDYKTIKNSKTKTVFKALFS